MSLLWKKMKLYGLIWKFLCWVQLIYYQVISSILCTLLNVQIHHTSDLQLSYFWLGTCIFLCRKRWIKPCFKASYTSHLYDSRIKFHYIDNHVWTKQTDIICKKVKNSQHYVILITIKQRSTKRHIDKAHKQNWTTRIRELLLNNNTMTGCISTKSRQIDINKNRIISNSIINKDTLKNTITRY